MFRMTKSTGKSIKGLRVVIPGDVYRDTQSNRMTALNPVAITGRFREDSPLSSSYDIRSSSGGVRKNKKTRRVTLLHSGNFTLERKKRVGTQSLHKRWIEDFYSDYCKINSNCCCSFLAPRVPARIRTEIRPNEGRESPHTVRSKGRSGYREAHSCEHSRLYSSGRSRDNAVSESRGENIHY